MPLEPVVVTAQRTPQDGRDVPASVTALTSAQLQRAGVTSVKEAAIYAPNVNLIEFTARSISNPAVRGVGGSTTNPGVTTYIDGVPQLSADTSSRELLDVERIEFVRGAQGTLYGRNTLGGVINQLSRATSPQSDASGSLGFGDHGRKDARGRYSTPLTTLADGALGATLSGGYAARDGYNLNTFTGQKLDDRSALFGQGQLQWQRGAFDLRLILATENAEDGDFALTDLAQLRARPHTLRHDFTGLTQRRIQSQTLRAGWQNEQLSVESISGRVAYTAFETTDLDLSEKPDLTRRNRRLGDQLTQEFRLASRAPLLHFIGADFGAQTGMFGFTQSNDQDVANLISGSYLLENGGSFVPLPPPLPAIPTLPINLGALDLLTSAADRTRSALDDRGIGLYAETTLDWGQRPDLSSLLRGWSLTLGIRHDYEKKQADITGGTVLIFPSGNEAPVSNNTPVQQSRSFSATSPRAILRKTLGQHAQVYASLAAGYRAGGFNPQSPNNASPSYGEEHSSNLELGSKLTAFEGRVSASLAAYSIQLRDLQLNLPIPNGAGRFYVSNVGHARNQGIELEAQARPWKPLTLFLSAGTLDARFGGGSQDLQGDVSGKRLPYTDPFSSTVGFQFARTDALGEWTLRAEAQRLGGGYYDSGNSERQSPNTLINLRAGRSVQGLRLELWARNLTNKATIPLAIPYTGIVPSNFAGENAPPRTVGLNLSVAL